MLGNRLLALTLITALAVLLAVALTHIQEENRVDNSLEGPVSPGAQARRGVFLVLDKSVYHPGDTVHAVLVNNGTSSVEIGVCQEVYRLVGYDEWKRYERLNLGGCLPMAVVLEPGATYNTTLTLDGVLPGYYKLVFYRSAVFEVRPLDQPLVALDAMRYYGNATVSVYIKNYYHTMVELLPESRLEAYSGGVWVPLENATKRPLIGEPVFLRPGEDYVLNFTIVNPYPDCDHYRVVIAARLVDTNEAIELTASFYYITQP